jgi:hypothetical protein
MIYRWLTTEEVVSLDPEMDARKWARLNPACCCVLGAFDGEALVEFLVLQLYPILGPMLRLQGSDNGSVSRELASRMEQHLVESNARAWMAIADSPVVERICERHKMLRVTRPVFIAAPPCK